MSRVSILFLQMVVLVGIWAECLAQGSSGGTSCQNDNDCLSGYCYDVGNRLLDSRYWYMCARESTVAGKVAGGGKCRANDDCYSNFCVPRTKSCSTDSLEQGKVGATGLCEINTQCLSEVCVNFYGIKLCLRHPGESRRLSAGMPCRINDDCIALKCREMRGRRSICQ